MSRKKDRRADKGDASLSKRGKTRRELVRTVRDIIIAAMAVVLVLASLYAYCGVWPPMVVVESSSMMHGSDSQVGLIDTGDLTLVKKVSGRGEIVTYVEAANPNDPNYGFKTYGDFGNVIIYQKSGRTGTPVIHRAIAWIEYNASASDPGNNIYKGDLPDIGVYGVAEHTVKGLYAHPRPDGGVPLTIHLNAIFAGNARHSKMHDGFVTKGDHNRIEETGAGVDQETLQTSLGVFVEPVKPEWVVGRAEGELPWFGLLKLWISGQPSSAFPPGSVAGLVVTIVLLVTVPIALDYLVPRLLKRRKGRREERRKKSRGNDGQ